MSPVVILSPHFDDAVFSLAHSLRYWIAHSIPLRIINVYTHSSYAPRAAVATALTPCIISDLRRREDRKAIGFVAETVERYSLDLLDAPLQFDVGVSRVSGPGAMAPRQEDVNRLAQLLIPLTRNHCVVAPLGLGNHVNHLAVKRAALAYVRPKRLAFYEDLPYATWATGDEWAERLTESGQGRMAPLRPLHIRGCQSTYWKRQAARLYQSQIHAEDARKISGFSRSYGGGERLWVPGYSVEWNAVFNAKP